MQVPVRTARDLGAAIKQMRQQRGFSQAALAKEVGVHQPKISAVEKGAPGVRIGLILQILRTLDLELVIIADSRQAKPRRKGTARGEYDLDAIADTGIRR
jgi:transcriptional regulator with XRE-family HTH domain